MSSDGKLCSRWRGLIWDIGAACLMLWLPLVVFLRHNDYSLVKPEVALCVTWVLGAGAFWGLLMWLGRTVGRVLVTVFLLILLVDVQTTWLTTVGLRLLLNVAVFGVVTWLLRRRLSQVVVVIFGAMLVATVLQPPGRMVRQQGEFSAEAPVGRAEDLPFVLHIILDEYAAPEALDRRFDPDGAIADGVTGFLVDHGFTVYSRAYSRLFNTADAIPNILNRGMATKPNAYWPHGFARGSLLAGNDWFARLHSLGYDLHVLQSDFIRYVAPDANGRLPTRTSVTNYSLETVHALEQVDLVPGEKARFILGSYYRLSWLLGMFRDQYANLRQSSFGGALHLPDWDLAGDRVSPLSSLQAADRLVDLLAAARPGRAVFAHLLLPHFPYSFRADCSVNPMGRMWLNAFDESLRPARNTPAGRALRYPLYLQQLQCTNRRLADLFAALVRAGIWDNALIILHGDHGSRLSLVEPLPQFADQLSAVDEMDAFGTLLAIKLPGMTGRVDRRMVPVDIVMAQLFLDPAGVWPPVGTVRVPADLSPPWVLLNDRHRVLQRHPLREFVHGRAGPAATGADSTGGI